MNNNIVQIFLIGTIDILERHGIYYVKIYGFRMKVTVFMKINMVLTKLGKQKNMYIRRREIKSVLAVVP